MVIVNVVIDYLTLHRLESFGSIPTEKFGTNVIVSNEAITCFSPQKIRIQCLAAF